MANAIKEIAILTDDLGEYEIRDIGANALNIDVSYDANGNIITDATTAVASKKSLAEIINTLSLSLKQLS